MTPVIFDLDGTLIDSLPSLTKAANELLDRRGLPALDIKTVEGFVGRGERVFVERMIAATALRPEDFEELLAEYMPIYKTAALETILMPGVVEALTSLRAEGVPLGVVTNKPRAPLIPTLETVALTPFFDVILAGDDLERRKPDPEPLFHAMRVLGAESCIYVGDSDVDAETAKRAGQVFVLYTEGIRTTPIEEIPHSVAFNDFGMLPGIVRKLTEG
jgi:phosphoglycolate phosphatase